MLFDSVAAVAWPRPDRIFTDDFAIVWDADPPLAFASGVTVKVTLVRKSIQVTQDYEAEDGRSWLLMFENDLKQGAFG
jgi:hypothetical protein